MRIALWTAAFLLLPLQAWALPTFPLTFHDPLASQDPTDVIGDPNHFDISYLQFKSFTPATNALEIELRFNFGGGSSLGPFTIPNVPTLHVGDLFFRTATDQYAFLLSGHDGLLTGGLYNITGTQDARTVLGNPANVLYRPDAPVWASATNATLLGAGSINVATVNNTDTFLLATLTIPLTATMVSQMNNGFDFYFAAATCGNDEISGTVVPEPSTWLLISCGLIGAGILRRRQ